MGGIWSKHLKEDDEKQLLLNKNCNNCNCKRKDSFQSNLDKQFSLKKQNEQKVEKGEKSNIKYERLRD